MTNALSVKDFTCCYQGQVVLDNLSFDVEKGEIVCLLGASGCGKTTMLKAIAGLLPLCGGEMSIQNRPIANINLNVPPEQRNIGMIFQDYALFPHLNVGDNVGFALQHLSKKDRQARVDEMLSLVKLSGLEKRFPHQLSGGQQQRVAIARALANKPDLLLLDEPFSNIDAQVRFGLIKEIRKIFKEQGVTAIFVTHSREEAFAFADKLAVMNAGVIEQYGDSMSLYYQPKSRFVADFLGAGSYVPVSINQARLESPLGYLPYEEIAANEEMATHVGHYEWFIRPQSLAIMPNPEGLGMILEVQFMGDNYRYLVDVNGQALVVYANQLLALGQQVEIEIKPHRPILFNSVKDIELEKKVAVCGH